MKTFLLTFTLAILLVGSAIGQVTFTDTLVTGGQTTFDLRLRAVYPWVSITLENLGTGEDTLTVKIRTFVDNPATGAALDTSLAVPWIKDSEGVDVTEMIVPEGETKTFLIMRPIIQGLEISLSEFSNAQNTRVMVEAWKPD